MDNQNNFENGQEQSLSQIDDFEQTETLTKRKFPKSFWIWISLVVAISLTIICLNRFVFMYANVVGSSMENTLQSGDTLLANKCKDFEVGSIVIIKNEKEKNEYIIKRVVAVGGDTVEIKDGALYVNGKKKSEPYAVGRTEPKGWYGWTDKSAYTLKKNQVFYLGDNREVSLDARTYGPCDKEDVVAVVTNFSLWLNNLFK